MNLSVNPCELVHARQAARPSVAFAVPHRTSSAISHWLRVSTVAEAAVVGAAVVGAAVDGAAVVGGM